MSLDMQSGYKYSIWITLENSPRPLGTSATYRLAEILSYISMGHPLS